MLHAREDYQRIQDPSGKIPVDEPVFLIRGQDVLGASILRIYAHLASAEGVSSEMIKLTLMQADRMDVWERKKVPDLPNNNPFYGDDATIMSPDYDASAVVLIS